MRVTDARTALLPLLATIEPCPLGPKYLAPVPPLAIRLQCRPSPEPVEASAGLLMVELVVKSTETWLCDTVLKEHLDCYQHGAFLLRHSREQLGFRPEFCHRAYAFALWNARTYWWLGWIRDFAKRPEIRLAIEPDELRERLINSYYEALNGVELLCAMYVQRKEEAFEAVFDDGCLDRQLGLWLQTEETKEHVVRLDPCHVIFKVRPDEPESFCDHSAMFHAFMNSQKEAFDRINASARHAPR
jgi:hypothetical protein